MTQIILSCHGLCQQKAFLKKFKVLKALGRAIPWQTRMLYKYCRHCSIFVRIKQRLCSCCGVILRTKRHNSMTKERRYWLSHKEQIKTNRRKFYWENHEKELERRRRYWRENKDMITRRRKIISLLSRSG